LKNGKKIQKVVIEIFDEKLGMVNEELRGAYQQVPNVNIKRDSPILTLNSHVLKFYFQLSSINFPK
jgi:hypothetical protein